MTKTLEEIIQPAKLLHDDLSYRYYKLHKMSKEDFDQQHGKIWNDMEVEKIAEGYSEIPTDWQAEFDKVTKPIDKINILARSLGFTIEEGGKP